MINSILDLALFPISLVNKTQAVVLHTVARATHSDTIKVMGDICHTAAYHNRDLMAAPTIKQKVDVSLQHMKDSTVDKQFNSLEHALENDIDALKAKFNR
jgi:sugar phosphate isomerase/epimerase